MTTRTQRLDELPLTSRHHKILGVSGIGWALDALDIGLVSFVIAALAHHWNLTLTQLSYLGSIGFVGMALGAAFGGLLADRFGRRNIFAFSMLIYGLATGASALSMSLGMLIVWRFIIGLGLGAELPVASTYVAEFSPRRIRGRMIVVLEAFWALGGIAATILGVTVVNDSLHGWRWALAIGALPALYSLVVRLGLPESVRFLELRGRVDQAERIVRSFEAAAATEKPQYSAETPKAHTGLDTLSKAELIKRTASLWTIWFLLNLAYYGALIWMPTLLHQQGYSLTQSATYTLLMSLAQIPGYAIAAVLIESWGRRPTLILFLIGAAFSAVAFALATNTTMIIITGALLTLCNAGAWGALYAISPELYPTKYRARGTGAAASFGRLASIGAPLVVPPLLAAGGIGAVFGLFCGAYVIASIAAGLLPELKHQTLT